ncbi:hypothetical protein [Candidatus Amarolinea dominans]|uniref:hypothetical protein n=1 Tax=Candidatus Amarolinea dominans TaxID=3140696 RepID=UPI001D2B3DCD|nr:hypothetical protein [Anaerolineae bacterium]
MTPNGAWDAGLPSLSVPDPRRAGWARRGDGSQVVEQAPGAPSHALKDALLDHPRQVRGLTRRRRPARRSRKLARRIATSLPCRNAATMASNET